MDFINAAVTSWCLTKGTQMTYLPRKFFSFPPLTPPWFRYLVKRDCIAGGRMVLCLGYKHRE